MLYESQQLHWHLDAHAAPDEQARLVIVEGGAVLSARETDWEMLPLLPGWRALWPGHLIPVGRFEGQAWYAVDWLELTAEQKARIMAPARVAQAARLDLRTLLAWSERQFAPASRAVQLVTWARQHRFCGQCGQPVKTGRGEHYRYCAVCRLRFYPRISPCVIVLVTRGDEVLLAMGQRHRTRGRYSTLAGFMEPGESAEQAVHREVREEVGVTLHNVEYQGSQPWPFPHQLMLGFRAEYAGGDLVLQEREIADARWWHLHDLPSRPAASSISGWLIESYRRERQGDR